MQFSACRQGPGGLRACLLLYATTSAQTRQPMHHRHTPHLLWHGPPWCSLTVLMTTCGPLSSGPYGLVHTAAHLTPRCVRTCSQPITCASTHHHPHNVIRQQQQQRHSHDQQRQPPYNRHGACGSVWAGSRKVVGAGNHCHAHVAQLQACSSMQRPRICLHAPDLCAAHMRRIIIAFLIFCGNNDV